MSFFEELKRRNVFRVGIAYMVVGWLLLQVTDIVVPIMELPNSVAKVVLFLLMLGFPLVIFFAWAFELTPEGVKREKDVDRSDSITNVTGHKLDRAIIGILVVALGWFAWDKFARAPVTPVPESAEVAAPVEEESIKSIAVLPFVNMSEDSANEFFSDGISEEILNALAKVKDLKVAGRTSSFAFKGRNEDLREIGDALGVKHILEGSVRKAGNTVRITAQLIQVDDGFHLWSDTYDRELTNVFAIQDEIAAAILTAMKAELLDSESVIIASAQTDPEAYQLYLRAKQGIYERQRKSIEGAVAMLDRALEIDPNYAPALAQRGIAAMLLQRRNYGTLTREQAEPVAKEFFDRALQQDPNSAEAWAGLGMYHKDRARETQIGLEALEKAISLNPNLMDAYNWLQQAYAQTGDTRKSLSILEEMFERDPFYPPGMNNLILAYNRVGEESKSFAVLEHVSTYMGDNNDLLDARASIHISQGECSAAIPLLEQSLEIDPHSGSTGVGLGICLLQTSQYSKLLSGVNPPWMRILALHALGRSEEATLSALERAAIGDVNPLMALMNREGRTADVVEFFDERWTSLEQFHIDYPGGVFGNEPLLQLAYAFLSTGDQQRFDEAMRRVREDHDAQLRQGTQVGGLYWRDAFYHALSGDENKALDAIEKALSRGGALNKRIAWTYPALTSLEGNQRFEALQQQMIESLNQQRAELGLEAVDT